MPSLKSRGGFVGGKKLVLSGKKRATQSTKLLAMGILFVLIGSTLVFVVIGNGVHKTFWSEEKEIANSPWPMFRHDLNHTGLSPYDTSSNDGTLKWKFQTGSYVYSSPAIGSDGTIYVGSEDDYLYALNPDGTLKWILQAGVYVLSSPAIGSDGTI